MPSQPSTSSDLTKAIKASEELEREQEGNQTDFDLKGLEKNPDLIWENFLTKLRERSKGNLDDTQYNAVRKTLANNPYHIHAFVRMHLMQELPVPQAMSILQGLNKEQAYAISIGLKKSDIEGLNIYKLAAVIALHRNHLTLPTAEASDWITAKEKRKAGWFTLEKKEVEENESEKDWFNSRMHSLALFALVQNQFFTPDDAIGAIKQLDKPAQLQGIVAGLSPDEVKVLSTPIQIAILLKYKGEGITANHLEGRAYLSSQGHLDAIDYLRNKLKCSPYDALQKIIPLDDT